MWFWFWIHGSGWAEAGIGDGRAQATFTVSYLTDALGDLLSAVWQCGAGSAEARCSWEDEPGEYRWILRRDGDQVRVEILEFDAASQRLPDQVGLRRFETQQDWATFARTIMLGASRTREKHGEYDYKNGWGHPFPTAVLDLIQEQLHSQSRAVPPGDTTGH